MPFDPSQPFEVIHEPDQSKSDFDPSKPFEVLHEPSARPASEGVLAGDDPYKDVKEAIPFHGSIDQFKEGMRNGEQLVSPAILGVDVPGHEYVGKGLGAVVGAVRAAGTALNPIGKVIGAIPKYAQATGSALSGDLKAAGRDITGSNELKSAINSGYLDTGNKLLDTSVNTLTGIGNEVAKNPPILAAGIAPESINNLIKSKISGLPATNIESLASKVPEAISKAGKSVGDLMTKDPEKQLKEFGDTYREILAPQKGEINKVEIKSGKDINDYYKLAAENKLVLERGVDGKLDTRNAIEQVQEKMEPMQQELADAIASKPQKQFNIQELGEEAKSRLRGQFDNDAEYEGALSQVDREVNAIKKFRGEDISGSELNRIKSGMWKKGYDAMAPNANKVARVIGNVAKEAIEDAYKGSKDISAKNAELGDYMTLQEVLENAHGRVISKGKLGKYMAKIPAQIVGAGLGHTVGLPIIGEAIGGYLGGKASDVIQNYLTDPARITGKMAKKVGAMGIEEPVYQGKNIEQVAQDLAAKAKMQRLADSIKSQEYGKQAQQEAMTNEAERSKILQGSAQEMPQELKPNPQAGPTLDEAYNQLLRQRLLESKASELSGKGQMQRLADQIKAEELRKQLLKQKIDLIMKDGAGSLIEKQDAIRKFLEESGLN